MGVQRNWNSQTTFFKSYIPGLPLLGSQAKEQRETAQGVGGARYPDCGNVSQVCTDARLTKFRTLNMCGYSCQFTSVNLLFQGTHTKSQKGPKVPEVLRWRAQFLNLGFPLKSP